MLLVDSLASVGHGREVVILHGETLFRTDFNTEIAGTAFETVYLLFFIVLGDHNRMGRAPPAAQAAENTIVNSNFNSAPGNGGIHPLALRIHKRCRPADQVPQHGF